MKIYSAQLHICHKYTDSVYGPIFEGWMTGEGLNIFGSLAGTNCAMTETHLADYQAKVEARAEEWNQAEKIDFKGQPIESEVKLEIVRE